MVRIKVFVVDVNGEPLMPTHPSKARKLLKENKAKVVNHAPYTIKLLTVIENPIKQPMTVGIDDGSKKVGIAVAQHRTSKPDVIVFQGTIDVSNNIRDTLEARSGFRKARRSRLRYRKARWGNRVTKKCFVCGKNAMRDHETCREHKGSLPEAKKLKNYWLTPSLRAKKNCTIRTIDTLMKVTPITDAKIEVGRFDLQKLVNPYIRGIEYQQGPRYESDSVKEALGKVYGFKCNYCGKEHVTLEIEHIKPRSRGGTDKWSNLCLACHDCNQKKGNKTPEEANMPLIRKPISLIKTDVLKHATHTQTGKNYLSTKLEEKGLEIAWTYGRFASYYRKVYGLGKTHYNDAVIASVTTYNAETQAIPPTMDTTTTCEIKPLPTPRRQIHKATAYSQRKGVPKSASIDSVVTTSAGLKVLVEVNRAIAIVPTLKGKKLKDTPVVLRKNDPTPKDANRIFKKGYLVKAEKAGKIHIGRVSAIMSTGKIKLKSLTGKDLNTFSVTKVTILQMRKGVLLNLVKVN